MGINSMNEIVTPPNYQQQLEHLSSMADIFASLESEKFYADNLFEPTTTQKQQYREAYLTAITLVRNNQTETAQ